MVCQGRRRFRRSEEPRIRYSLGFSEKERDLVRDRERIYNVELLMERSAHGLKSWGRCTSGTTRDDEAAEGKNGKREM